MNLGKPGAVRPKEKRHRNLALAQKSRCRKFAPRFSQLINWLIDGETKRKR